MSKARAYQDRKEGAPGFSLVELMVAMAIVGILLAAVYGTFITFLTNSAEQAALSKRSLDTRIALTQFRRDIRSAGYGIAEAGLSEAVAGNTSSVTLRSVAFHSRMSDIGQHGVLREDGNVYNDRGMQIPQDESGIVMTPSRELLDGGQLQNITATAGSLFFVAPNTGETNYFYQRQYKLSGSTPEGCADGAAGLQFDDQDPNPLAVDQPILDCVLDLRIQYGFQLSGGGIGFGSYPSGSDVNNKDDDLPDLLKVGLMVQVGHEYRNQTPTSGTLNYSDTDLELDTAIDPVGEQEHHRWQVLEWTIPLENMP